MSINSNENEHCMQKIQRDGLSVSLDCESIDICRYHPNLKIFDKVTIWRNDDVNSRSNTYRCKKTKGSKARDGQ